MTSSSEISKLTYEPRNRVQSVAAIRDWFRTNSCGYFTDVPLCLNRTHVLYMLTMRFPAPVYWYFSSFLYRPIPLSTAYHSHTDTLLLRCMNNGQSILRTLGARFCSISDNNKSVRHFCTNKHVLSLYFLSSKFILFIFNKSLWKNFVTRILCYRTSFLTLLNS